MNDTYKILASQFMPYLSNLFGIGKILNWYTLFKKAFGNYKWSLVAIAGLSFFSSLLEGVGISSIIPVFSFVNGQAGSATDSITKFIEASFNFIGLSYTFRTLILFIGALFVLRIVVLFFIQYITARIVFGYEKNMRRDLFSLTVFSRWPFLSKQKVGHLDQLLITNTTNTSQFFGYFSTVMLIFTKTVIYTVIAVNISSWAALLTIVVGLATSIFFKPLFVKNKILSTNAEKINRGLAHFTSQHVGGMKAIKSMAIEEYVSAKALNIFDNIRQLFIKMMVVRGVTNMLIQFIGLGFVALVFVYMYRSPGFNFATFAVIVYAINQIFVQVQAAQVQVHAISSMVPYLDKAVIYMDEAKRNAEKKNFGSVFNFERELSFENIFFSYPERGEVVADFNLSIKKGEMVGIIGPSGAGKTTIVDLLLRLYEPDKGEIKIDGKNINEINLDDWRGNIGYVAQDIFILNDTIKNNIIFYNKAVSEEGAIESAKLVNLHDFIMSLPDGYDTIVGDRGVFLSGGQRQRIILARILATKPQLLVLDEATSSLDGESELAIKEVIDNLRGKTTVIIIAHRLSTISSVDKLAVLENGKIKEIGKPDDLLKDRNSYFYKVNNLSEN